MLPKIRLEQELIAIVEETGSVKKQLGALGEQKTQYLIIPYRDELLLLL